MIIYIKVNSIAVKYFLNGSIKVLKETKRQFFYDINVRNAF